MRRLALVAPALLLLAACSSGPNETADDTASAGTAATTATATTTVTASTTPSTAASDPDLAARLAGLACEGYVFAGTLDAASGSEPLSKAASTATSAAVLDPRWTDLAGAIAFLSAVPLTDVPADDQDRAATQVGVVKTRCADAGVTVS